MSVNHRQNATHAEHDIVIPIPSVRPNVYLIPALTINEFKYCDSVFYVFRTFCHSRFLVPPPSQNFNLNSLNGGVKNTWVGGNLQLSIEFAVHLATVRDSLPVATDH